MSDDTRKHFASDVFGWAITGLIFMIVNIAMWAPVLWQSLHG
jgi:hypothetical protein